MLGWGINGQDASKYLIKQGAQITIFDEKEEKDLDFSGFDIRKVKLVVGKNYLKNGLNNFDYIARVYAVPVGTIEDKAKGLAVLVHLRATSRRSVLFIYDSKATLLYQELLERKRINNVMKAVKDVAGKEYLWLNVTSPITYAINIGDT